MPPLPTAPSAAAANGLRSYGYKPYSISEPRRRVIWSWEGPTKSGKTDWLLRNAPGPVLYQDIDMSTDGMSDDTDEILRARGDIYLGSTPTGRYEYASNIQNTKEAIKTSAATVWDPFVRDYYNALRSSKDDGGIRSIIWDTATDFWDLCLNYTQGKEVRLMPEERTTANNLFKRMIKAAYAHDANLFVVHHMMPEFDNPKVLERKGFNRIHTLVQAAMQTSATKAKGGHYDFAVDVTLCRRDRTLEGERFDLGRLTSAGEREPGLSWAAIASAVAGGSPRDWK